MPGTKHNIFDGKALGFSCYFLAEKVFLGIEKENTREWLCIDFLDVRDRAGRERRKNRGGAFQIWGSVRHPLH